MSWLNDADVKTKEARESEVLAANRMVSQANRDNAIVANLKVHNVTWQVRDKDRTIMRETVDTIKRNSMYDTWSTEWILADNTLRLTTAAELELILDTFTLRRGEIFAAYGAWCAGDMKEPFVIEE